MIENFLKASLVFFIGILTLTVLLPVFNEIFGFMDDVFGNSVMILASSMILLLLGVLIYGFVQDSTEREVFQ